MRDREAGFTLLELMVTVAVIAILAAIALPSYVNESRKARAAAEVPAVFSDLRIRLEQFAQENGRYPASIPVGEFHPPGEPSRAKVAINALPQAWIDLRVRISGDDEVYCRYKWATGPANSGTIGDQAAVPRPAGFGFAAPTSAWYYLLAKCDVDGDGTLSWYMSTSVDPTIQKIADGE